MGVNGLKWSAKGVWGKLFTQLYGGGGSKYPAYCVCLCVLTTISESVNAAVGLYFESKVLLNESRRQICQGSDVPRSDVNTG